MARPKKEGMDYFPHDVHAFNDKKIEALRMIHGLKGYAVYFFLLEQIYQEKNFELDISDAETRQILCRKLEISQEEFDSILFTSIKHGCFDREAYSERGILTSGGIKKRAVIVVEKREKMREKYRRAKPEVSDAETKEETGEESAQSKEKKSKEKKSINKYPDDSPYMKMVDYFIEKIKTWMPDFAFRGSRQTWADDFRKLIEIDKATRQDVAAVMSYLPNDHFWRKNVLSAKKFREQFIRLKAEMASKEEQTHARTGRANATNSRKGGTSPFDGFKAKSKPVEPIRESIFEDELY